jgi:hypothetical protein
MAYTAPPPITERPASAATDEGDGLVLDLGPTVAATRIVLERDLSPLDRLDETERRRLLVRVLCGLVAYDAPTSSKRLAG